MPPTNANTLQSKLDSTFMNSTKVKFEPAPSKLGTTNTDALSVRVDLHCCVILLSART